MIEHEVRVGLAAFEIAPRREQPIGQPGAPGAAHLAARDDRVGIDIVAQQRRGDAGEVGERGHAASSRGSAIIPAMALAATVSGLAIWVRMPGPWRPSKLRLVLLIVRLPGAKPSPPA